MITYAKFSKCQLRHNRQFCLWRNRRSQWKKTTFLK